LYLLRWLHASNFKKENTWNTVSYVFILADVYNVSEEVELYKHDSLVENRTAFSNILGPDLQGP